MTYIELNLNKLSEKSFKEDCKEIYGEKTEEQISQWREEILSGDLIFDHEEKYRRYAGIAGISPKIIETFMHILSGMSLTICSGSFITGDSPVVISSGDIVKWGGLLYPNLEVWFPISYNKGLLWRRKGKHSERCGLGHSRCRSLNRRLVKNCYKHIYCPLPEGWLIDEMKKESPILFKNCSSLKDAIKNHSKKAISKGRIIDIIEWTEVLLNAGDKHDVLKI